MGKLSDGSVSIIVPLYHGRKYIPQLMQMVEACEKNAGKSVKIELVFSNDDPDETIAENISSDMIDVTVLNTEKNRGIHGARVHGLSYCTGDFVIFLDQDDVLNPECVSSQLSNIGGADAVVCRAVNDGRFFYGHDRPFEEMTSSRYMFSVGNGILSPGQVMMRREAVPQFWQENILRCNGADDWLLWLCMLYEGKCFVQNQDILYEHTIGSGNCSGSAFGMYQSEKEMCRMLERQNYLDTQHLTQIRQAVRTGMEVRLKELDRLKAVERIYEIWPTASMGIDFAAKMLERAGYKTVAIYGMGKMGIRLYQDIHEYLEVKCFIDRNARYLKADIPVYTLEDDIPQVDLVIVALADRGNGITADVSSRLHFPVRSIENILQDMYGEV